MAKKKVDPASSNELELNMTPMIDVIFQLIIFFMCSIHFRTLEGKMETWLPKDQGPDPGPVKLIETIEVFLVYTDKGSEGEYVVAKVGTENFPILLKNLFEGKPDPGVEKLTNLVHSMRDKLLKQGKKLDEIPYSVSFSDETPLQAIIKAVDIGKSADLKDVRFGIAALELSKKGKVKYKYEYMGDKK